MTRSEPKPFEGDYIPHGEAWDDGSAALPSPGERAFSERKHAVMDTIVARMRAEKRAAAYSDSQDSTSLGSNLSDYA